VSSSSGELPITSVFSCGARSLTACASFKFAGCWWRRSLAVDGGSGTRPDCADTFPAAGRTWQGMACVRSGQHIAAAPVTAGALGKTARAPGHSGARFWDAGPDSTGQALDRNPRRWPSGKQPSGRMARHWSPAGLASRWPRRDARLRTSGAARRSVERRHRAAAARGSRCAGSGHWLVLVIAWLAGARGSWWPPVGVVAGEHVRPR